MHRPFLRGARAWSADSRASAGPAATADSPMAPLRISATARALCPDVPTADTTIGSPAPAAACSISTSRGAELARESPSASGSLTCASIMSSMTQGAALRSSG